MHLSSLSIGVLITVFLLLFFLKPRKNVQIISHHIDWRHILTYYQVDGEKKEEVILA